MRSLPMIFLPTWRLEQLSQNLPSRDNIDLHRVKQTGKFRAETACPVLPAIRIAIASIHILAKYVAK